jgi:hypothetical protein
MKKMHFPVNSIDHGIILFLQTTSLSIPEQKQTMDMIRAQNATKVQMLCMGYWMEWYPPSGSEPRVFTPFNFA